MRMTRIEKIILPRGNVLDKVDFELTWIYITWIQLKNRDRQRSCYFWLFSLYDGNGTPEIPARAAGEWIGHKSGSAAPPTWSLEIHPSWTLQLCCIFLFSPLDMYSTHSSASAPLRAVISPLNPPLSFVMPNCMAWQTMTTCWWGNEFSQMDRAVKKGESCLTF